MVVICGGRRVPRSARQFYPFRQQSDFFYLTGINREGSILLLINDHPQSGSHEILFMRNPGTAEMLWNGPGLSFEEAASLSGICDIRVMEEFDGIVDEKVTQASAIYFNHPPGTDLPRGFVSPDEDVYRRITSRYPGVKSQVLSPLFMRLRMVKSREEVETIRTACEITGSAFRRALGVIQPGVKEYEIEAEISAEFIRQGTGGHAFEPIIAGGKNALILHYTENSGRCASGDLLLMDFGAEVNHYAADCTRTVPVSGRFSERQREIYDATLRILRQARSMMVPGTRLSELHSRVGQLWEEEHIRLGLYTPEEAKEAPDTEPLWRKYFMHGTSHSLGLDVHDPFDRSATFEPGMVLTCEPAIYIPGESTGIRLENVILITDDQPVDLMEDIPLEAEEIEELMQVSAGSDGSDGSAGSDGSTGSDGSARTMERT